MRTPRLNLLMTAAALLTFALAAGAVEVAVSVKEPVGIDRQGAPASGGVSFKPGDVKSAKDLVLVDAKGKPVPAQFTVLSKHADGSVGWVLVDTMVGVAAKGEARFTLKTGSGNPAPRKPLKISDSTGSVTFDTGVIKLKVNKIKFVLFDSVTVDGEKAVTGGAVELVNCELDKVQPPARKGRKPPPPFFTYKKGGKTFSCKADKPRRVTWEYKGPVRATLRLDGDFKGAGGAPLGYTARLTAWAGSGAVRVRFSVRNSNPKQGRDAFIERAALALKLAFDAAEQGSGLDWSAGGDGNVGLLVQDRHTAGVYKGPGTYLRSEFGCGWSRAWKGLYRQEVRGKAAFAEVISRNHSVANKKKGELGFHPEGAFALADRAHKQSEVWFDFYSGKRDAAANGKRAKGFRSKLLLLADGKHYSETQGLAVGHFGTLADEVATYKAWGWKGADDKSKYPRKAHQPFAFVPKESVHDVSEDDCVEGYLLQFLRTGDRGFFDWSEAWCGFYRGHSIYRTDWGKRWGVPPPAGARPTGGLGFHWYGPHFYDWPDSRMHRCHHYGRGIFDFYLMTGDVDALEAGLDLAEQVCTPYMKYKTGRGFAFGRAFGRAFLTAISAWKATRDDKWKKVCDHMAAMILKGTNWDPKLNIYRQSLGIKNSYFARAWTKGHFDLSTVRKWKLRDIPPRLDKYLTDNGISAWYDKGRIMAKNKAGAKWEVTYLTQVFELSACHLAMERYARLFESKAMEKRLVEVSEGVSRHWWSQKCQHMIGSPWFGWPEDGKVLDPGLWYASHDKCPANGGGKHSGYATRYTADMFARAYSFTKDAKWMKLAKRSWNRGSKRLYQRREQCAADDEVGPFAYIRGAHNNSMSEGSIRLFYEAPRAKGIDWKK